MKNFFAVLAVLSATSFSVQAETKFIPPHAESFDTASCAKTSEAEITAMFDNWNAALATLDAHNVAMMYVHDAILLPTVSNKPRVTHDEIEEYFVHFLKKRPHGTIDWRIIKIGCNIASDTGLYTFTLHDKHANWQRDIPLFTSTTMING